MCGMNLYGKKLNGVKMNNVNRVLVMAPHTDDGELGCGGTIARFIKEGKTVFYLAFSPAEKSVPKKFSRDILKTEVKKAIEVLGIPKQNLILLSYPVRDFPAYRQDILEDMIRIKNELKPDMVFLPCPNDTHQDHQVITQEGFRSFKETTMLGYEIPWNNLTFNTSVFVVLNEAQLQTKIEAMRCYKSQTYKNKITDDLIRSLAIVRGNQSSNMYAEAFELIRWVV